MKLRRCSLRKMMNDGLVNERIARKVLEGLTEIASGLGLYGDLKERSGPFIISTNV